MGLWLRRVPLKPEKGILFCLCAVLLYDALVIVYVQPLMVKNVTFGLPVMVLATSG
jgi:hypothetical protein